jgi:hypothetical protein
MQSAISSNEKKSWRRLMVCAVALGLMSVFAIAQTAWAQTDPLNFGNNFFVTGDYVVAGVGLSGLPQSGGYATGYINMPDATTRPSGGVPPGAQVVAAFLYWQTVESSQTPMAGKLGYFGPSDPTSNDLYSGPAGGYPITGTPLLNSSTPVSWGSGGCAGDPQGSKTILTYRADVRALLPVATHGDTKGNVVANGKYVVRLASSGSNGSAPLTLGASLVIIYRVMDHDVPLNSIVIYDGTYLPSNSSAAMIQAIEGFYQAAAHPMAKLTEIVGNGGPHKNETVSLNDQPPLTSLYGDGLLPPFPGFYDQDTYSETGGGSWDNPTWTFQGTDPDNPVGENASTVNTMVSPSPSSSNGGCVSWGAVIFSTTVKDSDGDGLLDKWETQGGYCDASINNGVCTPPDSSDPAPRFDDPGWVALPGANPNQKDIYVQMDYMCRNGATTCDPTDGSSFLPSQSARDAVATAFGNKGIILHLMPTNMIPEETCSDADIAPNLCQYPGQPGVVGWKGGFAFLKNEWVKPDGIPCDEEVVGSCEPRFQHGRKDSYHYALFGNALGAPEWSLLSGTLTSVDASSTGVTFKTSTDHGLHPYTMAKVDGKGRVTVSGVISIPGLNGTYKIQSVPDSRTFTIDNPTGKSGSLTLTDLHITVASGQAGTISGASDVGGEDTAVTLGLWGADGESDTVQEGIFMHELGHTLGLTHGGTYYDAAASYVPSYVPTYGPNCKPNYQSVMNYLFTVDLLGTSQALDYSEQKLSPLDENSLPAGVTTTAGSAPYYSTTRWYAPWSAGTVGSPAKVHCDGTPINTTISPYDVQPQMYRVSGTADPISLTPTPTWSTGGHQDVDFNGVYDTGNPGELQGYDDWTNLDLRQMGAAGNLSTAGGPGAAFNFGPGAAFNFGPGAAFNFGPGAAFNFGPGAAFNFGPGDGEITLAQANSVTRPPRNVTATVKRSKTNTIELDWMAPTFGQIGTYNIYRGVGGAQPAPPSYGTATSTTFTDTNVDCKQTYTYFVTAVLQGTTQESQPSNTVTVIDCKVQ